MLKVGVVGLGWMGRVHLRNYTEMAGVEVVGVVDVDPKALEEVAAQFGVATYQSLDELLENDLDAMSVCVPTSLHHETGLKIIEKKINLIIEKPLAATAAEGEELVRRAADMGVKLMVGHGGAVQSGGFPGQGRWSAMTSSPSRSSAWGRIRRASRTWA